MKRLFSISLIVMAAVVLAFSEQQAYGASNKIPIPEFYGVYLVSDGKLIELTDANEEKRLKIIGNMASSVKGIQSLSGVDVSDNKTYFIVYLKNVLPSDVEVVKLTYRLKMILGGDNAFTNPAKEYEADMWVDEHSVKLKSAPIEGKEDMLRVVPAKPLSKGVYALGIGGAWRSRGAIVRQTDGTVADFSVNCDKQCRVKESLKSVLSFEGLPFEGRFKKIVEMGAREYSVVVTLLSDQNLTVRRNAALILGYLGDRRALVPLIDLFKNDKDDIGFQVAKPILLRSFNNKRTVHLLASILDSGSPLARARAVLGLEVLAVDGGNLHAPASIVASLKDSSTDVRVVASRALGNIGNSFAVESLITALKDKEENVRESAARALGKLGDQRAVEPLKVLLKNDSDAARNSARLALLDLGVIVESGELKMTGEMLIFNTQNPLGALARGERPTGKGQCPLCHQFYPEDKAVRGPSLIGVTKKAVERIKDPVYSKNGGRAKTPVEYLAESNVCPSCFVVDGYALKGSNGNKTAMPSLHKPPISLSVGELIAIDTYLFSRDEGDVPPISEIRAAYEKFINIEKELQ